MNLSPIVQVKGGYEYEGVFYKSKEEIYFVWYLTELKTANLIKSFKTPEPLQLLFPVSIDIVVEKNGKRKLKAKHLLNDVTYRADFEIVWRREAEGRFFDTITSEPKSVWKDCPFRANRHIFLPSAEENPVSLIDVKGGFKGIHNNSAITFPIISKLLWNTTGWYVNKIIPKELFEKSFTPMRYFYTDSGDSVRKRTWKFKVLEDIQSYQKDFMEFPELI